MSDDKEEIEDYLDTELDPAPSESFGFEIPGPFSLGKVIVGLHFMAALLVLPVSWVAVQNGAYAEAGFYSVLAALILAAGVVVGRIVDRS